MLRKPVAIHVSGLPLIPPGTAEELSDLYDNSRAVPDYPAYLERWQARSRALRALLPYRADLAYGPAPRNRIDLFVPETSGVAMPAASRNNGWPLLIFLHGGYWQYLGKHDWSCVAAPFIARGMAVAIVGYTLCPEITVAGIVGEVQTACAHLYLNADKYKLDRAQFHVAGHSAGGHLTAMLLATDWPAHDARLPVKLFQSGIAVSGVFDLEPLTLTHLNAALRLTSADALATSPIFRSNIAGTPLLVIVGAAETSEFPRQSQALCAAWPATTYLEAPTLNHFSVIDAFHGPVSTVFEAAWRHMNAARAAA